MGKRAGAIMAAGTAVIVLGGAASLAWAGGPSEPTTGEASAPAALAPAGPLAAHPTIEKAGIAPSVSHFQRQRAATSSRHAEAAPHAAAMPTTVPIALPPDSPSSTGKTTEETARGTAERQSEDHAATPDQGTGADAGAQPSDSHGAGNGSEPAEATVSPAPRTLIVGGTSIPYRDVRGGTTPDAGAGLWLGSDAVGDGSWGYFVGHHPGAFSPVKKLAAGDEVRVCDSTGTTRSYRVRAVFSVEATATWKTIADRVTGYGESVILQTCTGDGATNTIVVAA